MKSKGGKYRKRRRGGRGSPATTVDREPRSKHIEACLHIPLFTHGAARLCLFAISDPRLIGANLNQEALSREREEKRPFSPLIGKERLREDSLLPTGIRKGAKRDPRIKEKAL